MIALLVGWGLSERAAKIVAYLVLPLLVLAAFYLALDAYGDARYREGRVVEAEAWKEAEREMLRKAAVATEEADREALGRALEYSAQVAEEKEKIDAAIADGTSPFDVLFPVSGMRTAEDR